MEDVEKPSENANNDINKLEDIDEIVSEENN